MDKNKVIESAAKLIAKGQLEKAAKEFQRALDVDPDDVRILQKLAELYQKMGKKDLAADCFEKVAKTYAAQGFYLKAVALYKQVLKVVERIEVNIRLAELYQQLGLIGDATKEWQNVAAYYEKIGDLKSSLDTLKKLVDLDPDNVAARIRLGEQYARQDNFVEAVSELRRAAAYLQRNGRQDDYLRVAERISHLDQGDATLARELAENYMSRGDAKRALAKLQICFKANPRDLQTLQMLARAFQDLGQVSKTVSVLKELARVHLDGQRPEEARKVYQQAAELAPDDSDVKSSLRQVENELSGVAAQPSSPGAAGRSAPGRTSSSGGQKAPASKSAQGAPRPPTAPIGPSTRPVGRPPGLAAVPPPPPPPTAPGVVRTGAQPPPPPPMSSPGRLPSAPGVRPGTSPGMRPASMGGAAPAPGSISKLLKETEVYVKYGLHEKALDHLARIFSFEPDNTEALEKSKTLALAMKRPADAVDALAKLVRLYSARSDPRADAAKAELRELEPGNPALQLPAKLGAAFSDDDDDRTTLDAAPIAAPSAPRNATASAPGSAASAPAANSAASTASLASTSTSSAGRSSSSGKPAPAIAPLGQAPANEVEYSDTSAPLEAADISGETAVSEVRERLDAAPPAPALVPAPPTAALVPAPPAAQTQAASAAPAAAEPLAPEHVDEALRVVETLDESAVLPEEAFAPRAAAAEGEDHFASDLAEADFYIDAGLPEDARAILEGILLAAPDHPGVLARLATLPSNADGGSDGGAQAFDAQSQADDADSDALAAELAAELASEVAELALTNPPDAPLDSAPIENLPSHTAPVTAASTAAQEAVRREDAQTHYDLGIAYKEMGLLDEAVAEFQLALEFGGGVRKIDCIAILAVCSIELGRPKEAVELLNRAVLEPDLNPASQRALGYELGQAYEAVGEKAMALAQYQAVERSERGFRDTAARIVRLGGTVSAPVARPKTGPISSGASARPKTGPISSGSTSSPPAAKPVNAAPAPAVPTPTPQPAPTETAAPPAASTPSAKPASGTPEEGPPRRNRKIGFI